ncbi:MAG: hypothetical protein KAS78_03920 [Candidatus Pacebacteria bacterium]|nr:hypothetical protein [Candidatus Paceibacterota bacterium]
MVIEQDEKKVTVVCDFGQHIIPTYFIGEIGEKTPYVMCLGETQLATAIKEELSY